MSDLAVKVSEPIALKARLNEDWLAVVIGLLVFGLALFSIGGTDLLGWAVNTSVYADITRALAPIAKAYVWLGGIGALLATYVALLVVLSIGVATLGADVKKFAVAFTAVFAIAYASWIVGSYAHIAAVTPAEQQKFGIDWSLKLTNEGGYIVALLVGARDRQFPAEIRKLAARRRSGPNSTSRSRSSFSARRWRSPPPAG